MGRPKRKEQSGSPVKDNDSTKRRRQTSTPASFDFSDGQSIAEFGKAVFKQINEAKDSRRGLLIAADFQSVPSPTDLPSYRQIIKDPIALDTIESKFDSYKSVDDMLEDFKLMEANAHAFNKANSLISQYATRIRTIVEESITARNSKARESTNGLTQMSDDGSQSAYMQARDALLGVLDSMLDPTEVKDSTGATSAGDLFRALVPKRQFPDYYKVIKQPISINMMQKKLKSQEYTPDAVFNELEDDVFLMLDNAAEYNEPNSEVMADARVLEKYFISRMAVERKKLGLPPRSLPPKGRYYKEIKTEDTVMGNGIESGPRILLKMNGGKKAESPASLPESKHTTAVSTPAATAQSPGPDQLSTRNPFKPSFSPHLAAASPANVRSTTSVSPMIANASMAQPVPSVSRQSSNASIQKPKYTPAPPRYPEFGLPNGYDKNGLIIQPVSAPMYSFLRRPGTTAKDSPIQLLRISSHPESKARTALSHKFKPEKETYKSSSILRIGKDQIYIRVEAELHTDITPESRGYGIWLSHEGRQLAPQRSQTPKGSLLLRWDLNLAAGGQNRIDVISDLVETNEEGKEFVEKAHFAVNVLVASPN
ncbi:hypothetical protein H072_5315 [Dactylellina haptotyla CBS 200.50]|uniref:Bromo domain-containing protein n=1 Tax=Dactylellina haptotyla (strain CBS 200.50) TaxID=1284197 RepID=S8BMT1_DACHA|nr:hypothetical protein H072_5315 [Dactylellina haptotyla CBS 200.50]